jgi:hypothetical protein
MWEVGASDEVWFDPTSACYCIAAFGMPDGPVLGIIDAQNCRWLTNIPTGPDSHSVAVDADTGRVFVPLTPSTRYASGGIGVCVPSSARRDNQL